MKVVMLRPSYIPELSAGNHLAVNLVEDIKVAGHDIEIIVPVSEKYVEDYSENFDYLIHRINSKFNGTNTPKRILRYIDTSIKMFTNLLKIQDVDVILTHSMPPTIGPLSVLAGKIKKVPVVYWEQDIVSQSIITTGITKNKFMKKIFYLVSKMLESISLKGSSKVITISEKFKKLHVKDGINSKKIDVIYNWIDIDKIYPLQREDNYLFDKYNLDRSKFFVTYCGNLGVPQNVEIMIDAAEMLRDEDIEFIIIGGGSREEKIKSYAEDKSLSNIKIMPLEPLENANEVYNIGDIGLVIAKEGTSNNGFPSKTWSILSAGQAIISCFDIDSELSDFVMTSKAGIAVEPGSAEKLSNAIIDIYSLKDKGALFSSNARKFVYENFSRSVSTQKFIQVIENTVEKYQSNNL